MRRVQGASRPQRHVTVGVIYKDTDDDDNKFVLDARPSLNVGSRNLRSSAPDEEGSPIAKSRRSLTLKKAKAIEPRMTVANEHIDVDVIADVAVQEKSVQPPHFTHHFLQGLESCRVAVNVPNSQRENSVFGNLLEAISVTNGDVDEKSVPVVQRFNASKTNLQHAKTEHKEGTTSAAYGPELLEAYHAFECTLNAVKGVHTGDTIEPNTFTALPQSSAEASRLASPTVDNSMKNLVETETDRNGLQNGMPSADENIERIKEDSKVDIFSDGGNTSSKKGINDEQHNMLSENQEKDSKWDEDDQDVFFPREDGDGEASLNGISDAPESGILKSPKKKKTRTPVKNQSQQSNTLATKVPKKDSNIAGLDHERVKSTSVTTLLSKKRPATWIGIKPFVSPVPVPLNSPSSSVTHRRVVGLSRRHRPPPLHPYLLGS